MAWVEPKTDWVSEDIFEVNPDWNRIKGNFEFLQEYARHLYLDIYFTNIPEINYTVASVDNADSIAKTGKPGHYTPVVVNTIEDAQQALKDGTFDKLIFTLPDSVPRYGNGPFWNAVDLNRIEAFQRDLYELLQKNSAQRIRIPYKLGGGYFAEALA